MAIKMLITVFLTGILCLSASAANWVDLGKSDDKQVHAFIDTDSIKPYKINSDSNDTYMSVFVQHTYINNNELRKKGYYYTKFLLIIDCNKRALGEVEYFNYGFKDELIDSFENKPFSKSNLEIVFPETTGGDVLKYVCLDIS